LGGDAYDSLLAIGKPAIPALEEAERTGTPLQRKTATELLQKIRAIFVVAPTRAADGAGTPEAVANAFCRAMFARRFEEALTHVLESEREKFVQKRDALTGGAEGMTLNKADVEIDPSGLAGKANCHAMNASGGTLIVLQLKKVGGTWWITF